MSNLKNGKVLIMNNFNSKKMLMPLIMALFLIAVLYGFNFPAAAQDSAVVTLSGAKALTGSQQPVSNNTQPGNVPAVPGVSKEASAAGETHNSGNVSPFMIIPFAALLSAIALMPFINKHFWEHNYHLISYGLGAIVVLYYIFGLGAAHKVLETAYEYVSFICLIGSLFIVTGGIVIKLKNEGNPFINSAILMIGAVLANILGTTGASMLLIRPFIRVNANRLRPYLVVFFIFIVSNVGGALTPIGDPPLFLGYLKGIPFFWVIEHVFNIWVLAVLLIIGIFCIVDYYYFSRDKFEKLKQKSELLKHGEHAAEKNIQPSENVGAAAAESKSGNKVKIHSKKKKKQVDELELASLADDESLMFKIYGFTNFLFLILVLFSVFISSPYREIMMAACAYFAYKTTPSKNHIENGFNFDPIKEVAILFVGIFATMMPALDWLAANSSALGIKTAGQFYWGSGILSSFLDNAPTYLNFLSAACGLYYPGMGLNLTSVHNLLGSHSQYIIAISLGSVFFGACTYIGNGPNFMVKSIAEQMKVEMPSFFGYIFYYSLPILIPVFTIIWALFLR